MFKPESQAKKINKKTANHVTNKEPFLTNVATKQKENKHNDRA